jgi:hypothetical protein
MAARGRPVAIQRCLGDKGRGGRGGEMALPVAGGLSAYQNISGGNRQRGPWVSATAQQ